MILVEAAARLLYRELVGRGLGPRHVGDPLEVRAGDVVLRRLLLRTPGAGRRAGFGSATFWTSSGRAGAGGRRSRSSSTSSSSPPSPRLLFDRAISLAKDVLALRSAPRRRSSRWTSLLRTRRTSSCRIDDAEHAADASLRIEGLEYRLLVGHARLLGERLDAMRSARARRLSRTLSRMPAVLAAGSTVRKRRRTSARHPSRRLAPSASSSASRSRSSKCGGARPRRVREARASRAAPCETARARAARPSSCSDPAGAP